MARPSLRAVVGQVSRSDRHRHAGPNPNGAVSQRYTWNDLNGDLAFQPGNAAWDGLKYVGGEFGALANNGHDAFRIPNRFDRAASVPTATSSPPASIASSSRACGGSVTYIRKREKNPITDRSDQYARPVGSRYVTPIPRHRSRQSTASPAPATTRRSRCTTSNAGLTLSSRQRQQRSARDALRRPRADGREALRARVRAAWAATPTRGRASISPSLASPERG